MGMAACPEGRFSVTACVAFATVRDGPIATGKDVELLIQFTLKDWLRPREMWNSSSGLPPETGLQPAAPEKKGDLWARFPSARFSGGRKAPFFAAKCGDFREKSSETRSDRLAGGGRVIRTLNRTSLWRVRAEILPGERSSRFNEE